MVKKDQPSGRFGVRRRIDGNMQDEEEVFQRTLEDAELKSLLYDAVEQFCLFIGYPKSGHSILGQVLNAHPDVCISHEMDCLAYFKAGYSRNQIFSMVFDQDRWFSRRDYRWSGYSYLFEGLYQGTIRNMLLLGDKKGGLTTARLYSEPDLLKNFLNELACKVSFIHMTRNPFDMITTMAIGNPKALVPLDEACVNFIRLMDQNLELISRIQAQPHACVVNICQEHLLAHPVETVSALLQHFDLPCPDGYLQAINNKLFSEPRKTRHTIDWPDEQRQLVEQAIARNHYFADYSFDKL